MSFSDVNQAVCMLPYTIYSRRQNLSDKIMQTGPGPLISDCQLDLLFAIWGERCAIQIKCVWSTTTFQDVAVQRTAKEKWKIWQLCLI